MAIAIILNGQDRVFEASGNMLDLATIVSAMGLKSDRVAVEHNGEIVPRATWGSAQVAPGDRLEVVHFVGGGCAGASFRA